MKVKELIKALEKMPQEMEVYIYKDTEWDYSAFEIEDANLEPVKVGETLDCGQYDKCGACERSDGYCVFNDDGVYDVVEERVVLDIGIEDYIIKKIK